MEVMCVALDVSVPSLQQMPETRAFVVIHEKLSRTPSDKEVYYYTVLHAKVP